MNGARHEPLGATPTRLRLDKTNGKVLGVCSGLANRLGMDATIIRLVFVVGTLIGFGSLVLIYLAIALLAD